MTFPALPPYPHFCLRFFPCFAVTAEAARLSDEYGDTGLQPRRRWGAGATRRRDPSARIRPECSTCHLRRQSYATQSSSVEWG